MGRAPPRPRTLRAIECLFEILEEFRVRTLIDPGRRSIAARRVLLRGRRRVFDTEHALEMMFENHRFQDRFYRGFFALTHAGKTLELLQELLVSDVRPHHGLTIV